MTTSIRLQLTSVLYQQAREKSRLFRQFHHIAHLLHYAVEGIPAVGTQATGTVLNALLRVCKIASAVLPQRIQRAVAEQAIKALLIAAFVARKILTLGILKKFVVFHKMLFLRFANARIFGIMLSHAGPRKDFRRFLNEGHLFAGDGMLKAQSM